MDDAGESGPTNDARADGSGGYGGSSGAGGSLADSGAGGAGGRPAVCGASTCKRVFLTANRFAIAALGGVMGADAECQSIAGRRGLGGKWMAWISDYRSSPATRFTQSAAPYRLLNGAAIANDWSDLTDSVLAHPIDTDEMGTSYPMSPPIYIWTGTTTEGKASAYTCEDWTNIMRTPLADYGVHDKTDERWTSDTVSGQYCDDKNTHLYCFEQ